MADPLVTCKWSGLPIVMKPFYLTYDQLMASHPSALMEAPVESHYVANDTTIIPIWYTKESGGNLYFDADIKAVISKEHNGTTYTIKREIFIIANKYDKDDSQEISYDVLMAEHKRFSSKTYSYDNLEGGNGPGPFAFNVGPSGVSLSAVRNGYINERDEIKIVVVLTNVVYCMAKSKLALKIFEYFMPELFEGQIENRKKYYKLLLDRNTELKKKQQELTKTVEQIQGENKEFNSKNSENSRLAQELDRIQTMMRSDDERANELKARLENSNFTRFITNIDNLSQREILSQLDMLTPEESVEVSMKLVQLKQNTMVERIDGDLCGLCFTNERNTVITPCNHRFFCNDCTSIFASNHKLCPMCCQPYTNILNLTL
jgi:hypothetical protein